MKQRIVKALGTASTTVGLALAMVSLTSMLTGCAIVPYLEENRMPSPIGMTGIAASIAQREEISPAETQADTGVTATEIKIGTCCALSGSASSLGVDQLSGAQSYLNYVNEQGGVYGRKIKLLTHDDSYDPSKALKCFKALLQEKVFAGAFFLGTPLAARYVPLAETHGVPIVGLYTGAQLLHTPFRTHVISVRASYCDETRELINHLWATGRRKVAVIYPNDAFGASVLSGVKLALQKHRSTPIALGSFARTTQNFDDAIAQVRPSQPDVVIVAGTCIPVATIVQKSHAKGWKPIFATVSFLGSEAFIKAAGKDAEGTIITQVLPLYTGTDLPTAQLYKKLLRNYYPNRQPSFAGFEGFVDAMVLVEGLKGAGRDLTRAKFIHAIESIKNRDVGLGNLKLSYSSTRHKGFDAVYATVVRGQKSVALVDWNHL